MTVSLSTTVEYENEAVTLITHDFKDTVSIVRGGEEVLDLEPKVARLLAGALFMHADHIEEI